MAQPIDPNYAAWLAGQQAQIQQAPQQYAPPAPQQYQMPQQAPQGMPAPYQMHIPTNVQITTPPAPVAGSAGPSPRLQDMGGRLLLISPTKIERGVPNDLSDKPGAVQDRLTCDIVILGNQPIAYGGKPEEGKPHTMQSVCPSEWPSKFVSGVLIVGQLEDKLPERNGGVPGFMLGVLERNPNPNAKPGRKLAWKLSDPTPAQIQEAQAFVAARAAGQIQSGVGQPLPGAPAETYTAYANSPQGINAQPQYQQPQYAPPAPYAPQAPAQPAVDPNYAAWLASQQAPAQSQYAPPQQQWQAPPPATPPTPQLDLNTPPANFDPNIWAQMPMEVRAQILQSAAAPTHWG